MTKTTKRVFSILLICTMLLTALPSMAFATDQDAESQSSIMERVRAVIEAAAVPTGAEVQGIQRTASGTLGGAPWTLSNGIVTVGSGLVRVNSNPWRDHRNSITQIVFTGTNTIGPSIANLFNELPNLTTIVGIENWDTSDVTSMRGLFANNHRLTSVGDLSNWDTSNVTDMSWMFANARALTSVGDLSNWDTSLTTTMASMFQATIELTSLDFISNWNTSNVTDMRGMFRAASELTSLDLSSWNTSNVTTMQDMFRDARALTSIGDLSNWDTSNVTYMREIFRDARSLTSLNLSGWDTSSMASTMSQYFMFLMTGSLRELTLGSNFTFTRRGSNNQFMPDAPNNADFSGFWRNVGTGTVSDPQGVFIFTAAQLVNNYNGAIHADTWVWQPRSQVTDPPPTVSVGTQDGTMTAGQAGTVAFPVTTANIPNGSYTVTVANLPTGVTVQGQVTITNGSGTLTLAGDTTTLEGVHNNLTLTISGETSHTFTLWIDSTPNRIIQLNRSGIVTPFAPQPVGYTRLLRFSTVVQNISDTPTGDLTVTISGPNASAFEITHISREAAIGVYYRLPSTASALDIPSLAVGNAADLHSSRRFLIQPVAGLPVGTHTARVTVSVDSDLAGEFDEYFYVEFVVQ